MALRISTLVDREPWRLNIELLPPQPACESGEEREREIERDLRFRCDVVRFQVSISNDSWSYCDLELPSYSIYESEVKVEFHMDLRYCTDRFRISFVYIGRMNTALSLKFLP